ncbi:hypothetical protein [Sutcliffiella cohnii]|uniref:hypothetical protein n=1 Tax=Sutcliffiella cohnii TaxID=33932 RepID=UPI00082AB4BA|nr:hypothetical protein [Sutcliffiella cohnii]
MNNVINRLKEVRKELIELEQLMNDTTLNEEERKEAKGIIEEMILVVFNKFTMVSAEPSCKECGGKVDIQKDASGEWYCEICNLERRI